MGVQSAADKYISRGGRTNDYDRSEFVDDLCDAANFLVWAESEGEMFGGVRAADAYKAFCRLLDVDGVELRKIVRQP